MERGWFKSNLLSDESYTKGPKKLIASLDFSHFVWLDDLMRKDNSLPIDKVIVEYLKELKKQNNKLTQRPFIYFIGYRKKIRFLKIKKSWFSNTLKITILVGDSEKIKINFRVESDKGDSFNFYYNDKTLSFKVGGIYTEFSIHGFVSHLNIALDIETEIGYVGKTINPEERPTNRKHRGLTDICYSKANDKYDIFIFYNQFKIITKASSCNNLIDINIGSSYVDDIGAENEALFLEKILISYFKLNQFQNLKNEESILGNSLATLAKKLNISTIFMNFEVDGTCEYFTFGSREVLAKRCHQFACDFYENSIQVRSLENFDEILQ